MTTATDKLVARLLDRAERLHRSGVPFGQAILEAAADERARSIIARAMARSGEEIAERVLHRGDLDKPRRIMAGTQRV